MILQVVNHLASFAASRSTIHLIIGFIIGGYVATNTEWGRWLNDVLTSAIRYVYYGIVGL